MIGGIISKSLALLTDALHNFSDVISVIISYIAEIISKRKASFNKTLGYKRAKILAVFINTSTLIIFEAIKRFQNPQEIKSNLVI